MGYIVQSHFQGGKLDLKCGSVACGFMDEIKGAKSSDWFSENWKGFQPSF